MLNCASYHNVDARWPFSRESRMSDDSRRTKFRGSPGWCSAAIWSTIPLRRGIEYAAGYISDVGNCPLLYGYAKKNLIVIG